MSQDINKYFQTWRMRPELFFKDVLGVTTLEDYQIDVLHAIVNNKQVSIKACHSLGKTFIMARVALWFFSCFRNSIVITTAPTYKQVEKLLWGELRDAYKNAKMALGGKLLNTQLKKSDKWYCMGFSPQKSAGSSEEQQGSTFQGFHSDYVLIIFDEATGVDADIWKMARGLMTSGKIVKFVAIANPTTRACEFFKCFSSAAWKQITLTCFDSPNLRVNGFNSVDDVEIEVERLQLMSKEDQLRELASYKKPTPHLVSAEWVIEQSLEWGVEHPLTVSKAFGQFPNEDESVLIKMRFVEEAQKRDVEIEPHHERSIGVDVARFGSDKSVICEMVGTKETHQEVHAKRDTGHISGSVIRVINGEHRDRKTVVMVDATGIGAGVYDNLVQAQSEGLIPKDVELYEVHFGSSPVLKTEDDKEEIEQIKSRFVNLKSRMFNLLAVDLEHSLSIISDMEYLKELPTLKYKLDSKSKMRMESKDEYKKRTGRSSPDRSDALALANLGRYVKITYGSFANLTNKSRDSGPRIRQSNTREFKTRIKPTEY